jgi:hypothetical protein
MSSITLLTHRFTFFFGLIFWSSISIYSFNAEAGCEEGTVSTAISSSDVYTPACTTSLTTFTVSSSGSILGGYPDLGTAVTALVINSTSGTISNYGVIGGTNGTININAAGTLNFINKSTGIIYGNYPVNIGANIRSFNNEGQIYVDGQNAYGGLIYVSGNVSNGVLNSGTLTVDSTSPNNPTDINQTADKIIGDMASIYIDTGKTITGGITNTGIILNVNPGRDSRGIDNYGSIDFITNTGSITAGNFGIVNAGIITTLNNDQGASSSALSYSGNLPTNYNIIINSASDFGKIAFTSPSSTTTTFGIGSGSTVAAGRYASVITGLSAGSFAGARLGTYGGYSWTLEDMSGSIWDLIFSSGGSSGPSSSDTQSSIQRLASNLRSSYNIASLIANYPNSNTYDCNLFDVKGMCISAGGRYSTVDNPSSNSSAAVVTLGYKVSPNIRIGGFLDQSVNTHSPTGIDISNKHPMMGAFAYWNQNADGLGYQVKLANAYQDKDLSTTRDVIGTSEAGRGNTSLNTRSYVSELSYAFMYKENTLVRPYFALRHTSIGQDAYTETGVTTPLTYSALNDRTTSALMGVKFKHALTPKANLIGSLGIEQDLNNKTDRLTASGVSGLTSENFSGNIHHTRPVASLGATYDIAKSQRLTGEVLVQQLPFQSTAGATAYFNYMIGF